MKHKKMHKFHQYASIVLFACMIGFVEGLYFYHYSDRLPQNMIFGVMLLWFFVLLLSFFIHILLHEAGHLIFGLIGGYRFLSFRIVNFMWIRENGKIRLRRFSIPGTGGQCMMLPPESRSDLSRVLYNAGGVLVNLITSIFALSTAFFTTPLWALALTAFGLAGSILGLSNGIPFFSETVANDGANILIMHKNPQAKEAYHRELMIAAALTQGTRLRDMPDEWFTDVPSSDPLSASISLITAQRLMDSGDLSAAEDKLRQLLVPESFLLDLHWNLACAELLYCELVNRCRPEELERLHTPELVKFMESVKTTLTALHTRYAWALLAEHDFAAAEGILVQFEKTAARHPYPCEIEGERELLARVKEKANP